MGRTRADSRHPLNDEQKREEHTDLEKQDQGNPENASDDTISGIVADYESKIDDIAELVARVRHEINNPLTGVLGQAQLLLREDLSESARRRAETIEGLAIRLRDVVGQLRDVQKTQKK
jgi:signal transduction histidine kinase